MVKSMREIFIKKVDRPIDGVIKADDDASLLTELDEYVITEEIGLRLEQFLEAYNNYDNANGVWISGFFGSGKSHLLKMLALLLENREVDGATALAIFLKKDAIQRRPMIAGSLRKAVAIPSKSILFNIDQKADVISKSDVDALLAVFQKVFDDMCGYFGKQPHIAQFERDLDQRGVLQAFRQAFEWTSGKPWERGREQALLERANIAKAFAVATSGNQSDASDILSQYRADTRVSIEDFANMVKAWIDLQGPNFRLNFFVDEIGQYIADNTKLMTNLQTVAESLNTKCRGQAWIIVTAQQDIASVIGDMTAQQENDFSKIQARLRTRMPLNSADVAEVIQTRLLDKTPEATITLQNLYDREENNLRTLFDFADHSIRLKNFRDRQHFVSSYPFPPYQYTLFQMAISALSQHNAFEGKHASVGERSMLGVFQEVAKAIAGQEVGGIATFDLMFEGIRSALKTNVQQSIQIAEKNLDDPFAVRVLKALFLVKYVKEFKPTVRNIGILLLAEFNADQKAQTRRIEEALSLLERNTLIQRNGEVYEFLTNEEKDVEAEIKALAADPSDITRELETMAFDMILRHRKVKHAATGNEYPFTRKLDDHVQGREHELSINIISPFGADVDETNAVRMRNTGREELAVLLKPDERFVRDLSLAKKTEKFIKQTNLGNQQRDRGRILSEKGEQNARRFKDLETRLRVLLREARLFVRGDELEIYGDNEQERLVKAFQTLVDKVYVNLPMLRGIAFAEADIAKAANPSSSLFGFASEGLSEPEQEVLNQVLTLGRKGLKASVKLLDEHFTIKPYGWPTVATLCIVAKLSAKGKLEARSDGTVLQGSSLAQALRNSNVLGNILLTPQVEYTAAQIRKAKDLHRELFGFPADGGDARTLGAEWAESVKSLAAKLETFAVQTDRYPFLAALDPLRTKIGTMVGKPAAWYLTEPAKDEDTLLDAREDVFDKISSFMGGGQKAIYDDAREFLRAQEANLPYVDSDAAKRLHGVLDDPGVYRGSAVQDLKSGLYDLKTKVGHTILEERKIASTAIDDALAKVVQTTEFKALDSGAQSKIRKLIDRRKTELGEFDAIGILRERGDAARTRLVPEILQEIAKRIVPPKPEPEPIPSPGNGIRMDESPAPKPTPMPPEPVAYVSASTLKVPYSKPYLSAESDVDEYVSAVKQTLMAEIAKGRKVTV